MTRPARAGAFDVDAALSTVEAEFRAWSDAPVFAFVAQHESDPWRVLVSCILSLRTLDQVTTKVAPRLLEAAPGPREMAALSEDTLAELAYPVAFYRNKASQLRRIGQALLDDHAGQVPATLDALLTLPGVGRKTANLVLTEGHGLPGICVDTHVHRIMNRWGYVRTRTPDATELRLREKLPERWWMRVNLLLVALGQKVCRPTSPRCSTCPLQSGPCRRVGVTASR